VKIKKSRTSTYRHFEQIRHKFEEIKEGRSNYIRLIKLDEGDE
jgi:hypothetical protein